MESYVAGCVLKVEFNFSTTLRNKQRPVIVIKKFTDSFLGCAITHQVPLDETYTIPITSVDFKQGKLPIDPSYINCNALALIDNDDISNLFGLVKNSKLTEIKKMIIDMIKS